MSNISIRLAWHGAERTESLGRPDKPEGELSRGLPGFASLTSFMNELLKTIIFFRPTFKSLQRRRLQAF